MESSSNILENAEGLKEEGKVASGRRSSAKKTLEAKGAAGESAPVAKVEEQLESSLKKNTAVNNRGAELVDPKVITVVKRNGMLVPFRKERILNALEKAFRDVKQISSRTPLPQDIYDAVQDIAFDVVAEVRNLVASGESITVEGIQDVVEIKIMENGHFDVARGYIRYREERKELRENSPQNMKVVRRDGKTIARFNPMKIAGAIERAFRASLKIEGPTPEETVDLVNLLTNKVVLRCSQINKEGATLEIERIQDEIERLMMTEGHFQVAKDFIIYRARRAEMRQELLQSESKQPDQEEAKEISLEQDADQHPLNMDAGRTFAYTTKGGNASTISEKEIRDRIKQACKGLEDLVSVDEILEESIRNFYEGIREDEVDTSNILAARSKIEKEPAYSRVAARLLLDIVYRETIGAPAHNSKLSALHQEYFLKYLDRAVEVERVSPELKSFDLKKIAKALDLSRDLNFEYLGLQTLYDRYLIHHEDIRLETPQIFWMRVAMGLALGEKESRTEKAIEFYDVLSQFLFTSSTPTLFNSGTNHPQMSSCYLTTVMDDLKHIFKCVSDDAQLSKWAGGLGNDWTNVRATGARIKGTNGRSQGVIPFLKVANDTAVAVNQGGKRKGAMCAYLESWHLDIEDFLELRKNTGDERRRTHDMNTSNWIPDLFMKRVVSNGQWTLFSPSDVPDLHDLYGKAFEQRYVEYEKMAETGQIQLSKKIEAVGLWRKMLSMLFETGHPWITFKDPSNLRSPQDHVGVVHSSNLCTEILLNTSEEETAVCNLGSINLVAHVDKNSKDASRLNLKLLEKTIRTAVRMLDNVIDINFYPTDEAKNANLRHRPIGLGLMGFQDALFQLGISYASPEAVDFADRSMEAISYYAILASTELAKERGVYSSYKGSKWDRGVLPIDSLKILAEERGVEFLDVDSTCSMDWDKIRQAVKKNGMRNSNTMAIAPTATISNITGVTQSIEPAYKHLYAKSNLSGEFIVHNEYLVRELKARGIWDRDMIDDLKYFDGSILEIERIPADIKAYFLTAFEIEPEWLIQCASKRQKWIDMGQSLNLYIAQPSGKRLNDMYMMAWRSGLKTTYYLRSQGATQIEKSTVDINRRGLQPRWMKNKSESSNVVVERIDATDVESSRGDVAVPRVCGLDGDCESCQ